MKNITLIIILGYSNFVVCQSKLSITPSFCQSWAETSIYDHEIELYKEGKLVTNQFYPINDFTVEDLEKGKYLVKYKSIFNQEFQLKINLNRRTKKIIICIDDYQVEDEKTFIEQLKENDTLEIRAFETGCEYNDFGKLQLVKNKNRIKAILHKDSKTYKRTLNKHQKRLMEEVENKIRLIKRNEEDGFLRTYYYEITSVRL